MTFMVDLAWASTFSVSLCSSILAALEFDLTAAWFSDNALAKNTVGVMTTNFFEI